MLSGVYCFTEAYDVTPDGEKWLGSPFPGEDCSFAAWTPTKVILPHTNDGLVRLITAPRNPEALDLRLRCPDKAPEREKPGPAP